MGDFNLKYNDDYMENNWPVIVLIFCICFVCCLCCCYCCPCCLWYKRRHRGTVYHDISHAPVVNVVIPAAQNPTGYPITQQENYAPQQAGYARQQGSYPQQGAYPTQPGGYLAQQGGYPPQPGSYPPQPGGYPPPLGGYPPQQGVYAAQTGAVMQPQGLPVGLPPSYSEVANLPSAPGTALQDPYAKQAPFNPYFASNE